jgi:hypothetical protein
MKPRAGWHKKRRPETSGRRKRFLLDVFPHGGTKIGRKSTTIIRFYIHSVTVLLLNATSGPNINSPFEALSRKLKAVFCLFLYKQGFYCKPGQCRKKVHGHGQPRE